MIKPKNILEIGTFTGYATLSLAEGLAKDGTIYTVDKNPETAYIAREYFSRSKYSSQIKFIEADAKEAITELKVDFDLVFIDADKENYPLYIKLLKPKMKSGSIIVADNVLWYGKVLQENFDDEITDRIKLFNKMIAEDPDFENIILPLRDGLNLIIKK